MTKMSALPLNIDLVETLVDKVVVVSRIPSIPLYYLIMLEVVKVIIR